MAFLDIDSDKKKDTDTAIDVRLEEASLSGGLVGHIREKFQIAEDGRYSDEQRWLKAYKNYRGLSDGANQDKLRDSERSRVFVKITKVKVLAAVGQISDILFANKKFPLVVESTPHPEGIPEFAHLKSPQEPPVESPFGFPGDQMELLPGATEATALEDNPIIRGLGPEYDTENLVAGPAKMGQPQIKPAALAASNMEKIIHDQLLDTDAVKKLRKAIFECCLLGTGVIKGPFTSEKTIARWRRDAMGEKQYDPIHKDKPNVSHVSCWNLYPDPNATSIDEAEYVIQRHKLNRQQLRKLKDEPYFNHAIIEELLANGPNYEEKYFEAQLQSDQNDPIYSDSRYEVLEYWGTMDAKLAQEAGLEIFEGMEELSSYSVNAWISGNKILRLVVNPFTPERIPFHVFPYEVNPYQMFGVGIAENMEDAQLLMNGHIRMAIDNLALAGNVVFDIDEAMLVPGQSYDIYPGKVFRRQSGVTGTAINSINFPNTAPANAQMYDKARQLADEETGIPSIMHGQTGVTGTGRTASGLSMLMSSSTLSIKSVIKNIDDYLLKPLGETYFQWNMQFNEENPEIEGDLEIKPRGTSAVMQKEVRTQRLVTLLQTVANPTLAPFVKIPNLIRELAISQDIDPNELVNDVNEAAIFADVLRGLNEQQQPQGGVPQAGATDGAGASMDGSGGVPVGANPADDSGVGGGNIGVGDTPLAGEAGFTGNIAEAAE
tara:strand:- start:5691 stop:7841 length:2151 start_codon:yes stop_codon:yes gene_type:complete